MKIAVVGAGLIGSAAARHLAKAGHDVTLIGPGEPADFSTHPGSFASHYDEGRITRMNDRKPFFARASVASIRRYGEIEAESGIPFFTPCGALMAGSDTAMAAIEAATDGLDVVCDHLDPGALDDRFPYLSLPDGYSGKYEPSDAGHISPRNLVAAQQEAARRHGAKRLSEEARDVSAGRVTTESETLHADEVIVAAGGWTDDLLGRQALDVYARTVALHEIGAAEAERLKTMPSLVMESHDDIYILPPLRYPDGKLWLKLGGDPTDDLLEDKAAINDWYRSGGNAERGDYLTERIKGIIPGLAFEDRYHKPCVTTWSKDRLPDIRRLAPGLIVAAAGNGAGAKCSDELGRMAAAVATGEET
ncbi:MAG: NAD(P)/FAD-dependent oxidoreductase [Paracoccaceae bacterium]